jgi:hypothetical protein
VNNRIIGINCDNPMENINRSTLLWKNAENYIVTCDGIFKYFRALKFETLFTVAFELMFL